MLAAERPGTGPTGIPRAGQPRVRSPVRRTGKARVRNAGSAALALDEPADRPRGPAPNRLSGRVVVAMQHARFRHVPPRVRRALPPRELASDIGLEVIVDDPVLDPPAV